MSTCSRLYYVSKVCLRLLRKYTTEIYPNDSTRVDRSQQLKKRSTEVEERNETQIRNFFLITCMSIKCHIIS